MNLRLTIVAASIAALPLMATTAHAATPLPSTLMAAPVSLASPQETASLVNKLAAQARSRGLNTEHGFAVGAQHPGVSGTRVSRVQHTYKGLPVFGSETVVVSNSAGDIVSESVSDRASGLGSGGVNSVTRSATTDIDTTPAISAAAAIAAAVDNIGVRAVDHVPPQAQLLIYPVMKTVRVAGAENKSEAALNALDVQDVVDHYELAYLVQTRMISGSKPVYYDTVVSAKDGRILRQW